MYKTAQKAIEHVFDNRETRIRVWYGDIKTGKAWPEEWDIMGYIGRSTADKPENKIFLLVHNRRSLGGPGLLMDSIVRIDTTSGRTIYKHPTFSAGEWTIHPSNKTVSFWVKFNNKRHVRFSTYKAAERYIDFMKGNRYAK
mgnify:CR=1 FL=1